MKYIVMLTVFFNMCFWFGITIKMIEDSLTHTGAFGIVVLFLVSSIGSLLFLINDNIKK